MKRKWEWRGFWPYAGCPREVLALREALPDGHVCLAHEDEVTDDVYLVPAASDVNLKVRGQKLVIKAPTDSDGALSSYDRVKLVLPVPLDEVSVGLGLKARAPGVRVADADELARELTRAGFAVRTVRAHKERRTYELRKPRKRSDKDKKCALEVCRLTVGDDAFFSVCLESKHKKWLRALLDELPLGDARGESYVAFLRARLPEMEAA